MTFTFFAILISVVSFLLVVVIMVQNPKGGGLSSTFGGQGGQMIGSVQKTNEFLDKATWTLASSIAVLVILSSLSLGNLGQSTQDDTLDIAPIQMEAPAVPAAAPTEVPVPTETAAQ